MSNVKTKKYKSRKYISVRGTTYNRIRKYCDKNKISISGFVENLIQEFFTASPDMKQEVIPFEHVIQSSEFANPFRSSQIKKDPLPRAENTPRTGGVFMF